MAVGRASHTVALYSFAFSIAVTHSPLTRPILEEDHSAEDAQSIPRSICDTIFVEKVESFDPMDLRTEQAEAEIEQNFSRQ